MLGKPTIDVEHCCVSISATAARIGSDCPISEMYDVADNSRSIVKQEIRSRRCSMLQTAEDVSLEDSVSAGLNDPQPNLISIADPTRDLSQPNPETRPYEGAFHGVHTLNERGDWLTLSLKVPTEPVVDVLGVGRDDLRLSFDTNFAVVAPVMKDLKTVQLREENEVTISGAAPLVIITSAKDSTTGTQPGDVKGITTGHPPSITETSSVNRRLPRCTRGKALTESFTLEPLHQKSCVHQLSCVQTVGHGPGKAPRCQDSRNPLRHTGNENSIMNSQSRQPHTAGKSSALLDQINARPSESSVFVKARCSEGQLATTNSVTSFTRLQIPCPWIAWDLINQPNTSGYCRSACRRRGLPECLSHLLCSLEEQTKLSLKFETPLVEISHLSKTSEFRNKLAPVLPSQNLRTKLSVKEQCEHCRMDESECQQPLCNQLERLGNLESTRSKIKGRGLFGSRSSRSDLQNDRADSKARRELLGQNYSSAAQVWEKPRPEEYIETPLCKGLVVNDVACCSSSLPPRQARRAASIHNKVDSVRYTPGKIVNSDFIAKNPDMEDARRICRESLGCSETVAGKFDSKGEGENLQVEGYKRADSKTESYICRFHGILQDFEKIPTAKGCQSREHFVQGGEVQRTSVGCPLAHAVVGLQKDSSKCKSAMSIVDESQSENNNYFKEAGKCTIMSLTESESKSWKTVPRCDLCNTGPSLALGEWYAWCCGLPASRCWCPEQKKMKKRTAIGFRKTLKLKSQGRRICRRQWSGKVHKMCALWSSEVFQKDSPRKGNHLKLLDVAVKRGKNLICRDPECRKAGATLGCRVKNCRHSYHYPCAERLASRCLLRMWDCLTIPIACVGHRYVEFETERAIETFLPKTIAEFERDLKFPHPKWKNTLRSKILSKDVAEGQEAVQIPCTNDVDDDPLPKIIYTTKCWRMLESMI